MAPNERVQLLLEPVRECQSPISLTVEVGESSEQEPVALFFSAPPPPRSCRDPRRMPRRPDGAGYPRGV